MHCSIPLFHHSYLFPQILHPVKHTLACSSPSFTPLLREMSVSGDCKVTFRKEAYSWLSINQDKTEKITSCSAWLLSTCISALGLKRISPTQPKIHTYAFCLAITNFLPSSIVVNSLGYLKQQLPYLIINLSPGPSFSPHSVSPLFFATCLLILGSIRCL